MVLLLRREMVARLAVFVVLSPLAVLPLATSTISVISTSSFTLAITSIVHACVTSISSYLFILSFITTIVPVLLRRHGVVIPVVIGIAAVAVLQRLSVVIGSRSLWQVGHGRLATRTKASCWSSGRELTPWPLHVHATFDVVMVSIHLLTLLVLVLTSSELTLLLYAYGAMSYLRIGICDLI